MLTGEKGPPTMAPAMTIRLFDVEAQRAYEKEWEGYEQREQAKLKAGKFDFTPSPRPPEPLVDSREPRTAMHAMPTAEPMLYPSVGRDMRNGNPIDKDGTSSKEQGGTAPRWSSTNTGLPFTTKE